MCKEHVSDRELLEEVDRRIEEGRIKPQSIYYYDVDRNTFRFSCRGYILSFNNQFQIEKNYFIRTVYKTLEPTLIKAREDRQQEQQKKTFEALKIELQKKKKKQ